MPPPSSPWTSLSQTAMLTTSFCPRTILTTPLWLQLQTATSVVYLSRTLSFHQATSRPRKKRRTTTLTTPFIPRTEPTTYLWLHLQTATPVVTWPRTSSAHQAISRQKGKERNEPGILQLTLRSSRYRPPSAHNGTCTHLKNHLIDGTRMLHWSPWLYSDIVIPDHPSGSSALTCSLPPFPHCPGPLLASDPSPVRRPQMSVAFSQEHPQLAAIYQAVQAVRTPNYRGACQPVPHNLSIQAWRDRSHLFLDASLVEVLEF